MKKIQVVLILLICFGMTGFSQSGNIKLSPEYKLSKNKILKGHLHSNNSGHYMYFTEYKFGKRSSLILEKYDKKFKQKFSKEYKVDKKNVFSYSMKYFKGKFAWLMYEKNKSDDFLEFFLTPINLKGKSGKPKTIAKFKYERKKDFPKIRWSTSSDTTKILFIAEDDRNEKKENYEVYLTVIDNEFNTIWEKKVKLPYSQRRVTTKSWELADDGTAYFVSKVYEDNKTKESKSKKGRKERRKNNKTPAYDMYIYSVNGEMDKPEKYELKLKDAFVKGVKVQSGENSNDLACVGFFGDSRNGPTQGVFYLKLSAKDGSALFANKRKFTPKELAAFGDRNTSKDRKSKDSGLDQSFKFDDIVFAKDGSIFATAEENYSYTVTRTSSRGVTTSITYYVSNSMILIDINPEGKVDAVSIIPKRQRMREGGRIFQSYALMRSGDKVYFMYNDDKDNIRKNITDPDKIRRISSAKDCVAVLTTIEKGNKMNRKQLFTKKEAKTLLMPSNSVQISDTELFFFNSKPQVLGKNRFRFGILSLK